MTMTPRTIRASDAQDERLAALPLSAALTYAYLPVVLDDEGRAAEQPAVFNGRLWPLRADEHPTAAMVTDLAALVDAGVLCRYTAGGHSYVHDPDWRDRQKIARPVKSTLPVCPVHDTTVDAMIRQTVSKVSEQVTSFLGTAASGIEEARTSAIRDTVTRIVEDVTFAVDPTKAMEYGQKVRRLLGDVPGGPTPPDAPGASAPPVTPDAPDELDESEQAGSPRPRTATPPPGSTPTGSDVWADATDDSRPEDDTKR